MRTPVLLAVTLSLACSATREPATSTTPTAGAHIATVEVFRAARSRGDVDAARALLGGDPRIWYDAKDGDGSPWKLGGGRWQAWDEHFRGETVRTTPWTAEGDRVWADMIETNDYFRLTESTPGAWRGTYFFDTDGRIAGFLVAGIPGASSDRGRREEFETWARTNRPEEAEYLMPDGSIDPTGDRSARMRALLDEWRASAGLPAIE